MRGSTKEVKLSRWPFGGRDICELYKSIDVRRWHREGRLLAGRQFSWSWTSGGEPSGTINVRTEVDAVVLIYRVRSFLAEWKSTEQRVSIAWTNCHFGGRRPWFTCSVHTNEDTADGGWPCCTSLVNRSRAESAMGWLMPASRAGYCFATCARRRALGCGSAAIRIPVSRFPPSPAACIGGRICCFGRRQRRLKLTLGRARPSHLRRPSQAS